MRNELDLIDTCLQHLNELPFVDAATVETPAFDVGTRLDGILHVRVGTTTHDFALEVKRTNLTTATAHLVAHRLAALQEDLDEHYRPFLFARRVTHGVGNTLINAQVNYVDLAGNCYVTLGQDKVAHVQGKRAKIDEEPRGRGLGAAGFQVFFALLAFEQLINGTVREIAETAGVATGTVVNVIAGLEAEGLVGGQPPRRMLLEPTRLLERWQFGYETLVRKRWTQGEYQTPDATATELENRLQKVLLNDMPHLIWAWGGGAAAMRLTGFYRGEHTVLHVHRPPHDLPRRLEAIPARRGNLTIIRAPTPAVLRGLEPMTAHPLLVYTELATRGDDRAREAAELLRQEILT